MAEERIYIREAAEILNRRMDTLRKWDRLYLPVKLRSHREDNGRRWRYWTPAQLKGIIKWMEDTDRRPGKGLPHWKPSEEEVDELIEKLRKPRKVEEEEELEAESV